MRAASSLTLCVPPGVSLPQAIIADPTGQIVQIMGVSAAQTSTFFMTFVMISVRWHQAMLLTTACRLCIHCAFM